MQYRTSEKLIVSYQPSVYKRVQGRAVLCISEKLRMCFLLILR